jgi:hypothetical protein
VAVTNVETARPAVTPEHVADPATDAEVTKVFSRSVLVSGVRCTLAYVVFPWLLPLVGLAGATGPVIGLIIGVVAIGFNIASIRRFHGSDHRWKWAITALNVAVIVLLLILAVEDIRALL